MSRNTRIRSSEKGSGNPKDSLPGAYFSKRSVYDFNATLLHLMGLDHERLTFYHKGIERRLTNVHGNVVKVILA